MSLTDKIAELKRQNPMYGSIALNSMRANAASAKTQVALNSMLENAYNEALRESKAQGTTVNIEAFYCHFLEIGDITNREHRIYNNRKGIDNGGHAARKQWTWAMHWLLDKDEELFARLIPTFIAFVSLAVMTEAQVRTEKKSKKILEAWGILIKIMSKSKARKALLAELKRMWNSGNPMDRIAVAKFMRLPRLNARTRIKKGERVKRELQSVTKTTQNAKKQLLDEWCAIMGFEIDNSKGFAHYKGWTKARAEYNGDTEYVLFSSGKIRNFDQVQFTDWLDGKLDGRNIARPNDHVVRCHLLNKDNTPKREQVLDAKGKPVAGAQGKLKWDSETKPFSKWLLNWEAGKLKAQEEERTIKEKVRKGEATKEDEIRLKEVSKEAKVKQVAHNIPELIKKMGVNLSGFSGTRTSIPANVANEIDMSAHSIIEKIKMNAPVLLVVDCSQSMTAASEIGSAANMAALFATIVMLKNPDANLCDVICTFGSTGKVLASGYKNSISIAQRGIAAKNVEFKELVNRTASFTTNLSKMLSICNPSQGSTNIDTIYQGFKQWYDESGTDGERLIKKEIVQSYPTIFIISDGYFNSSYSPAASIKLMQENMRKTFGWEGFIVIWDVTNANSENANLFLGMENVIHINGSDPARISKVFERISDVDIVDTFIQLRTTWQSNRYEPIKAIVSNYYKHLQKPERAIPKVEIVE